MQKNAILKIKMNGEKYPKSIYVAYDGDAHESLTIIFSHSFFIFQTIKYSIKIQY